MSFFMLLSSPDSTHFHVARSGESLKFSHQHAIAIANIVNIPIFRCDFKSQI